jgi:hypothetical protein
MRKKDTEAELNTKPPNAIPGGGQPEQADNFDTLAQHSTALIARGTPYGNRQWPDRITVRQPTPDPYQVAAHLGNSHDSPHTRKQ